MNANRPSHRLVRHAEQAPDSDHTPAWWGLLWAAPWSLVGLLLAAAATLGGARWRVAPGALEVGGGRFTDWLALRSPFGVVAVTLGHVIVGRDLPTLAALRAHELVHVRQYERWGPLFVPAYAASSAWQWWRGGHPYLDNRFEREARRADRPAQ